MREISHIHKEKITLHYHLKIMKKFKSILTHENHPVSLLKADSQVLSLEIRDQ